ncbi:UvrD-helicase domain-containing protein [Treponema sp. R80B11-R83G3]
MNEKTNIKRLNEEQKKAAFCEENAVVAAGAGSGKTMVLAHRFAWLLTEKGYKVDEILTLTFTKKAAAQMYKRIYSLLSQIAQEDSGIKSQRAQKALDDFIHARIQTLDSYSTSIVKQCAPRYGIRPDFQIDQQRCYNIALEVSYPFFITHRHHPAVKRLYSGNRPNNIVHNIFADVLFNYSLIDKPRDFLADLDYQFNVLCSQWDNQIKNIKKVLDDIKRDIGEDNSFLPILVQVIEKEKAENNYIPWSADIKKYFNQLKNTPVETVIEEAESHPLHKSFLKFLFFLHAIKIISLRGGKKSDNPVKKNIYLLRDIYDAFSALAISCMQAGFIISIMSLLSRLQKRYLERKRTEGVLTFHDVASLSRTILIEQTDIRRSEKDAFKSIMIDEFQDNNELQKDILFLLAERSNKLNKGVPPAEDLCKGKLFFVGDEKQSIYFFRGADVSVFRKLKEEIKSDDLPLKTNYRSSAGLIGAFNAIFGGIYPDSEEKTPSVKYNSVFSRSKNLPLYEAEYAALNAGSTGGGNLTLCILNKKAEAEENDRLSADENEARFVAEKIEQLLSEKYQPDDIAILFRKRSTQHFYEKHLRTLGIPYACEDINDLFYGGPVNDILSVLRLAAHPMDKAAYAEMLRSPFAGLSLSGTAACLSVYGEAPNDSQPFDGKPLEFLEAADKEKYLCGKNVYLSICEKAKVKNISELVSELWYNEGYRYETEWNPQTSVYRELFDYLFHLTANADAENQGLASFTDSMIELRDSGERLSEIEIPLERKSAVHITTIHKSKGLEFPVVFVCSCGKKSQVDNCDDVYLSDTAGLVFSPPPPLECRSISGKRKNFFWEQANEETKRKRTAELRRLLYVAMTRAEKELYITGSLNIDDKIKTDDFSLLLKKHIEEEQSKGKENYIEGDSILNNDTMFGLLLPAIASHIPDEGLKKDSSFFNLEEIPVLTEEDLKKQETGLYGITNDQNGLNEFFKKVSPFYERKEIIKTLFLRKNHITPVSLKKNEEENKEIEGKELPVKEEFSGIKSRDVFRKVDSILSRFSQSDDEASERFNSGSFGTIAHICVEALLENTEIVIPSNISGLLNEDEFNILLEAGKKLARRFVASPLGKIAQMAKQRESEFPFRTLLKSKAGKEIFINGTIDLFFADKDAVHIVDFKTDSSEKPWEHTAQMACYYQAISNLFATHVKKECRIWLYYLRTGHAVEMTDRVRMVNIEQKAFE